jgi:hypothetical protein
MRNSNIEEWLQKTAARRGSTLTDTNPIPAHNTSSPRPPMIAGSGTQVPVENDWPVVRCGKNDDIEVKNKLGLANYIL